MSRQKINFIAAIVSIVLAIQALIVVLLAITTGWDRQLADEGAAAHIFQILIMAEAISTAVYLGTVDWQRLRQVTQLVGFQFAIFAITFATGIVFKL